MKRTTAVIFLAFIACIYGCEQDDPNIVRINDVFTVGVGEKVKMVDDRSRMLYVNVSEVQDSRCPEDANCIDQGNVMVKAVIEDTRNSQFTTLLCLGNCSPSIRDIRSFVFYNIEYTIQLVDVIPYPTTENIEQQKRVIMKLYRN